MWRRWWRIREPRFPVVPVRQIVGLGDDIAGLYVYKVFKIDIMRERDIKGTGGEFVQKWAVGWFD